MEVRFYEETGAIDYQITPICVYSVVRNDNKADRSDESFGMLYYADIKGFETILYNEIEKIEFFDEIPSELTYPLIQPELMKEYLRRRNNNVFGQRSISCEIQQYV